MILADTHAHLHFNRYFADLEDVISRFREAGGTFLLNIGTNLEDSKKAIEIAEKFGFKAAVGVHPHDSKDVPEDFIAVLRKLASSPDVLAIGETGLDYYRNLSPKNVQIEVFKSQIELALDIGKPLVIHIRDAYEDAYEILKSSHLPDPPGVIHAFSADKIWAKKFVDLGFVLGIGGPVTYPKNHHLREAVEYVGVENILTETDCPYLPPQKFRGRRNEPAYVVYVLEELSRVLKMSIDEISLKIIENVNRVFLKGEREL